MNKPGNYGPSTRDSSSRPFLLHGNLNEEQSGIDRFRGFGVSDGTFKEYLLQFKAVVTTNHVSHSIFKPTESQIQLAVGYTSLKRFPGIAGI